MTRSKFLLYCVTPRFRQNFGNYEASVRSRFLNDMDKSLYVTKTPEWGNDVRTMLATTIGKPIPPPDDSLSTKNKGLKAKQEENDHSYSQPVYSDIRFGINGNRLIPNYHQLKILNQRRQQHQQAASLLCLCSV
ncbi:hypothetical protein CU097_001786 [Rhizopus azygosporus]|uniref:Uncharacterized protein n=1 Tax=Rhizopus azygosporus TaxID=86630 RepID=A0A367ITG3_RHIAZ|nr:hypothetical protein CU097_001786 [Rhizopus azygosporus]